MVSSELKIESNQGVKSENSLIIFQDVISKKDEENSENWMHIVSQ